MRKAEITQDDADRFYAKVDKSGSCWEWTGYKMPRFPHGQFRFGGRTRLAHRFSYTLHVGDIPDGLQIHHECENPSCVNPDHLSAVTAREHAALTPQRNQFSDKTHCKRGHEFSGANLHVRPNGHRTCKACQREAIYRWREENPEKYRATRARYKDKQRDLRCGNS